jgi:hypothetical protein
MKRTLKILGWTLFTVFGLVILLAFLFFLKLPSPAEIGQSLVRSKAPAESEPPKLVTPTATVNEVQVPEAASEDAEAPWPKSVKDETNLNVKNERDLQVLTDLTDPEQPKSQVCDQLGSVDLVPDNFKYDKKTFAENFRQTLFNERQEKDPLLLGMVAPIRHFLQQPKMRELLQIITDAQKSGQDFSLTEKATFYAKLVGVYREMNQSKKTAEILMDRGYHLMMLTRALKKNPSLVSDFQVHEYCQKIEKAANQGAPFNWSAEKEEFQGLMQGLNVDLNEIDYDANYKTQLEVKQSEKGVHFQGGWIDALMPNEEINIGNSKSESP